MIVESILESGKKIIPKDYYSGEKLWRLNPKLMFDGNFTLTDDLIPSGKRLELEVQLTVIDQFDREHNYLPTGFVYKQEQEGGFWYAEP